jgi:hypothetical protein
MSSQREKVSNVIILNSVKILGIVSLFLKPPLLYTHTGIRIYKTFARPALSYESESRMIRTDIRFMLSSCSCLCPCDVISVKTNLSSQFCNVSLVFATWNFGY